MEPTLSAPLYRSDLSASMTKANNRSFNFNLQDYLYGRKPDFWVYLYNVSEQHYDVFRPPLFANLHIQERKRNEKYAIAARLPQPLLAPQGSVDSDEVTTQLMDTRRVMMDICNPDNLTLDQEAVISTITNVGNNLSDRGVFWSLNGPGASDLNKDRLEEPTEAEVKAATKRLERFYNSVLEKMRELETSNPKELLERLGPEAHAAADYFGIETSWHGKRSKPMDCPNCGARVKEGIAFHKNEEGGICVIDWKRTIKSGARKMQDAIDAGIDGFEDITQARQTMGLKPLSPVAPVVDSE